MTEDLKPDLKGDPPSAPTSQSGDISQDTVSSSDMMAQEEIIRDPVIDSAETLNENQQPASHINTKDAKKRFSIEAIRAKTRFLFLLRWMRRRIKRLNVLRVWLFAIIIGAAVGYAVIGFRIAIDGVSLIAFGATEKTIASGAASLSFGRAWLAPIIGGFLVSGILYLADRFDWLKQGRGQGVSDVIEARAVSGGRISSRAGVAAALVSTVSLGSGASAGREGPAVHLGAMIASFLDRRFGFSVHDRRTLLGCGAAAAVAASFNAPIAGVLFALEVVLGNYAISIFGPIALSSVTAAIISRIHLEDFPAFAAPSYGGAGPLDVPLSAVLGILCGIAAIIFLLSTEYLTEKVRAIATERKISFLLLPPIGGIFVGLFGAFQPEIFGVGYEAITRALEGSYTLKAILVILVLKFIATAITVSCRFGGGVFSPGLFVGVFVGAAFGLIISLISPDSFASPAYYAMVGMGAAAGAIIGAPISTTLIAFEITGDYQMAVSLLVAVSIATLLTQWICGRSFFHWQLSRRGYDLSEGPQGVILQTMRVRDVMDTLSSQSPLGADTPRLTASQSLGKALAMLERYEEVGMPVVEKSGSNETIGYLTRVRALSAYNRALIESHVEHHR